MKAFFGMTGLWQASGKNKLTFEDRLRLDFVILAKTVKVVWRGEGVQEIFILASVFSSSERRLCPSSTPFLLF